MEEYSIHLIGVEPSKAARLPKHILDCCQAIVVSNRFKPMLEGQYPSWRNCTIIPIIPLSEAFSRINEQLRGGHVAVLASGDPLFYGIGKKIVEKFGNERTVIHPAPSSMQQAFARFGINWDDASLISLHGRNYDFNVGILLASHKSVILTDGTNRPDVIANKLYNFLGANQGLYTLFVAENLGMEDERCISGSPELIANETFGPLCCVIVTGPQRIEYDYEGVDRQFECSGLGISCCEVASFALQNLEIANGSVFWCINSGVLALQAAQRFPDLTVYSLERSRDNYRIVQGSIVEYGLYNVCALFGNDGVFPDKLAQPDRILINGIGEKFKENVRCYIDKLVTAGIIIVSISENSNAEEVADLLHKEGLQVEIKTVNIKKTDYPPVKGKVDHTTTLITGTKVQDRI